MRDLNQPEAMDQAPPLDPWVAALGADRPRQASPAFKASLRERLVAGIPRMAQTTAATAGRRWNLSLLLALGLGLWWLTQPEGEQATAPAPRPIPASTTAAPTLPAPLPTAMTLVTPAAPASPAQPPTPVPRRTATRPAARGRAGRDS